MRLGHWQPGRFGRGEAGMASGRGPGHRRAAAVAAAKLRPVGDAERIAQIGFGQLRLGQAEFLALVEAHAAAQRQQQRHQQAGEGRFGGRLAAARVPAADRALDVVIAERPAGPALLAAGGEVAQQGGDGGGVEAAAQRPQRVGHVQAVRPARAGGDALIGAGLAADLAQRDACRETGPSGRGCASAGRALPAAACRGGEAAWRTVWPGWRPPAGAAGCIAAPCHAAGNPRHPGGTRPRRAPARTARFPAWRRPPPDCAG